MRSFACFALTFVLALAATPARAQWPTTAAADLPICTAAGLQKEHAVAFGADSGRAELLTVWTDERNLATSGRDIWAQRTRIGTGTHLWPADGIAVCDTARHQSKPVAMSASDGTYLIFWIDERNNSVYGQRIDALGNRVWAPNGVRVFASAIAAQSLKLQRFSYVDASAHVRYGAILAIAGAAYGYEYLQLQRVDIDGTTPWGLGGTAIDAQFAQLYRYELLDAAEDSCVTAVFQVPNFVRAQKVDYHGVRQWGLTSRVWESTANGFVALNLLAATRESRLAGSPVSYRLFTAANNSAIGGTTDDMWTQRADEDGSPLYAAPQKIADPPYYQRQFATFGSAFNDSLAAYENRGAFVAWSDYRDNVRWQLYAQRCIDSLRTWGVNGMRVCTANSTQELPVVTVGKDLTEPEYVDWTWYCVLWRDSRGGLYAQRLQSDGRRGWDSTGVAISTFAGANCDEPTLDFTHIDGQFTFLTTYRKVVSGTNSDLYAKVFNWRGEFTNPSGVAVDGAAPPSALRLSAVTPNPAAGVARVRLALPRAARVEVDVLDAAGRRVHHVSPAEYAAGTHEFALPGAGTVPPGLYFARVRAGGEAQVRRYAVVR